MGAQMPSRGSRAALSEINVTPFVDVMLVLLIIFMVTAPMMQQGLDVELPETANSGVPTNDEPFILAIKRNSEIYMGSVRIPANELKTRIQAIFSTRKNKQIYIQADRQVE